MPESVHVNLEPLSKTGPIKPELITQSKLRKLKQLYEKGLVIKIKKK
mgnify:CR=1 FL=1